jgi:gliding motility-associated-like protein
VSFGFNPVIPGPLNITYTVNNGPVQSLQVSNGQQLTLNNLQQSTQLSILTISSPALPNCNWPALSPIIIVVDTPPSAGNPLPAARICQGSQETISLFGLLTGEQTGGFWEATGGSPSAGGAFNAATASLSTASLQAGTYSFRYTVPGGSCPAASAVVSVDIIPAPVADAGADQFLNCNLTAVNIGGGATSTGIGITYQWTVSPDSIVIANPNVPTLQVSRPGVYTLVVTNADGCAAQDATIVSADYAAPVANVRLVNVSCFGADDGVIIIESVTGGQPPYRYALDEDSTSVVPIFSGLSPGSYQLSVIDQNGCSSQTTVSIAEPGPINAILTTDLQADELEPGQAVTLQLNVNPNTVIDTILWRPEGIASGNVQSVTLFPQTSGSYSAIVVDVKGCRDQDDINIIVRKSYPVYIPNAFSPNSDGVNDVLFIQAADGRVKSVRRFMIVSRWGETVFSVEEARVNDPSQGWDGKFRGELLDPAVFTYYAELEFNDGEIVRLTGDVTLLK